MATNNNRIILNGEEYEMIIRLFNTDKDFILPHLLFEKISITESIVDWQFSGYIDIKNQYEQIERFRDNLRIKNNELFYFRMDGSDKIEITLTPTFVVDGKKSDSTIIEGLRPKMQLHFVGSIYDTEDLDDSTMEHKRKRLYFWDVAYNTAIESCISFSSGAYVREILKQPSVSNLSDVNRAVETGNLLKYLFENKLGTKVSSSNWDVGVNKIFHVSPAQFTLNDNINYLLDRHVSSASTKSNNAVYPAILNKNRFDNSMELIPYNALFQSYKTEFIEKFTFPDNTVRDVPIAPLRSNPKNSFTFGIMSTINNYKYTKMAGMDSMKAINTKSVSWYDPKSKRFLTSIQDNSVISAKNNFKDISSILNTNRSNAMFVLNRTKTENRSIEQRYMSGAHNTAGDLAIGVCNTLKAALMLNDCISFNAIGVPHRTSGAFIDIHSDNDLQGAWEDRFLGAWLILEITHEIVPSIYRNSIVATKPNTTEGFDLPEDV